MVPPIKKLPIKRSPRLKTVKAQVVAHDEATEEESRALLALEQSLVALDMDEQTIHRVEKLPRDVGWLLITAGLVGVVVPGVLGVPFLVLGGLVLMPLTSRRAEQWLGGHSPKMFKGSVRQINRFLDDLERRYPRRQDV
jgi:hypothetical protein